MTTLLQLDGFFKDLVCFRDRLRKKHRSISHQGEKIDSKSGLDKISAVDFLVGT